MNSILYFLKQVVLAPYNLVAAPMGASGSMFQESARGRAMLMGLPAITVALVASSLILMASIGSKEKLENSYDLLAQKCRERKIQIGREIQIENQKKLASQSLTDSVAEEPELKSPLRLEFDQQQDAELIYLQKLISLNPKNSDYRFRLAIATGDQGTPEGINRCIQLMQSIAPDTEPGYGKAHLWLADAYLRQRPLTRTDFDQAFKHVEFALVRDAGNKTALAIKGQMLVQQKKLVEAYEIYEQLFETNPNFFENMYQINRMLNNENRQATMLDAAQVKFRELTRDSSDNQDEAAWAFNWQQLTTILLRKKDFEEAERTLKEEEMKQEKLAAESETAVAASRLLTIRRLQAITYNQWAISIYNILDPAKNEFRQRTIDELSDDELKQQLDLLIKANGIEPNNPTTLTFIAKIANSDRALANQAREIYDPTTDPGAPAAVFSEMGSRALIEERYDEAIQYFEDAHRKAPNDLTVLNNLAYAYLVCRDRNPDRALNLVNSAIQALSSIPDEQLRRQRSSNFYDTRGHALLQMDRINAAAASFEQALQVRPDNTDILEALVECYEKLGNTAQAEVFQKRLTEAREKNAENNAENNAATNGKSD